MFSPHPILNIRKLGIALAILTAVAYAPDRASAGCGDYNMPEHSPLLSQLAADQGSAPVKPKCHGPNCSRIPDKPVTLPEAPASVRSTGDDVTGVLPETRCVAVASRPCPVDQQEGFSLLLASEIFHPPR